MKKTIFFLLFLTLPFIKPVFTFAENTTTPTPVATQSSTTNPQKNPLILFLNLVYGFFVKTDYIISARPLNEIISDMTNYGDKNNDSFKEKHSFAGSRATDSTSQICLKGNVIKKVILGESGYPDSPLSSEANTNCPNKTIKDLAHYFVQLNQKFYCATDSNQLVNIDQNVIDKVKSLYSNDIPSSELSCYLEIYNDFYLTPKGNTDENEENTKKIIQNPIPYKDQKPGASNSDLQKQLDKLFSPQSEINKDNASGLEGLRPENDK